MRRARDNRRVHFVGYVREPLLQQFYRRADVQVVPSTVRGYGGGWASGPAGWSRSGSPGT